MRQTTRRAIVPVHVYNDVPISISKIPRDLGDIDPFSQDVAIVKVWGQPPFPLVELFLSDADVAQKLGEMCLDAARFLRSGDPADHGFWKDEPLPLEVIG